MDFGEAIPIPLDTADGFTVGRDDLTPPPGLIGSTHIFCNTNGLGCTDQNIKLKRLRVCNDLTPTVHIQCMLRD